MRMINDLDRVLAVEEIKELDASPVWKKGYVEDNPDYFIVTITRIGSDEEERLGEYRLDGEKETFLYAVENFNSICIQAAQLGFFKLTDFRNFELD